MSQIHDRLIMKCVSDEGREKIIWSLDINHHIQEWLKGLVKEEEIKFNRFSEFPYYKELKNNPLAIVDIGFGYETEVICKPKSTFGFADIVFTYLVRLNRQYESMSFSCGEGGSDRGIFKVIVEAKPELDDLGAVIRQLKTYKDILRPTRAFLVIATYSDVSKEEIAYLGHEGIRVVQF